MILTEEELRSLEANNDGNNYETTVVEKLIVSHRELYKEFDVYKTIALEFVTEKTARKIYSLLRRGQ